MENGVALRVVAVESDTRVAVWDAEALEIATGDCPWVADELRAVADRFQALAGAAMGPLGDRLDDSLRAEVTKRCSVRRLLAGDVFVEVGGEVPGMHIVGVGSVELIDAEGQRLDELGPGDFLFASEVMSHGSAPATARAGEDGALILFAERMAAHELLVSVPPLLEILAS
jgi:CRP-like cAMP-binding protein